MKRLLTIFLTLGALAGTATNVRAVPITTSTTLSFLLSDELATADGSMTTLMLDKFDAGLGTLMGVAVSFPWESTLFTVFPSPNSPASYNVSLTSTIDGLPFVTPFPYETAKRGFSCVSCPPLEIETKQGTLTYEYSQAIVAPFIGDGTLPVTLTALLAGSAQNAEVTGSWSGLVNVVYTYEPGTTTTPPTTSVPEPSSLLLLGCGIAAIRTRRERVTSLRA